MEYVPIYVYATFLITVAFTIYLFYRASSQSKKFLLLVCSWILVQSIAGNFGFYTVSNTMPPRFQLLLLPPLVFTILQFITKKGRQFIDGLQLKFLTLLHIIRIPVEIVLYWLYVSKAVPEIMTFEGRNFDLFSGITAPIVYYWGFVKNKIHTSLLIGWNLLCMFLLINIVFIGMFSVQTPFQMFGLKQPNVAILHFPFLFLPACIVPIVLFAHLASIRQLLKNESSLINKKS